MKKIIGSLFFLCVAYTQTFAQQLLQTPEQFLGYNIGTRFTPHWRIVEYFKYVALTKPQNVVMQQYGTTQEGRPLYICFVSTADNIANREAIRKNNLALSGQYDGTASESSPIVTWLTYNVHGNEPASSEAAMLTLYALANPDDAQKQAWLKNSLVIIDPCMNPDGRDRYVNWYNTTVGKNYNVNPIAREHREPWPYGRTNHYNFDMNRDWFWQTQKESQERMAQFNQWLPQIHVDFHEQGYNRPYYFAPAAAPYHEVLTQWQRSFQDTIGRSNAKYFDKNGWLFFTKETFDLFYPSYGDTYPLYNGSIGMTYEQGGIGGGLGVKTNDEDTLRLTDRVLHHYTSGISTVETASKHASDIMKNYHEFHKNSHNYGTYKSYVIKNLPVYRERILALQNLLDKNGIQYGTTSATSVKGYNYDSGKDTTINVSEKDIIITANQPRGLMVKVMFEPKTKLEDSITYDITSWALPYVFGLQAVASTQSLSVKTIDKVLDSITNKMDKNAYGYAFSWQGSNSATTVAQLIKKGIKVRYSDVPFKEKGKNYERGTLLILKKGNEKWSDSLFAMCGNIATDNKVQLSQLQSGMVDEGKDFGSGHIHYIKPPKVVLLTGETVGNTAAGEVWYNFDQYLDYPITLVNVKDFGRLSLSDYNVIIMPDGDYPFLRDNAKLEDFTKWIEKGGKVIALESAVVQLSKIEGAKLTLKKEKEDSTAQKDIYSALYKYENRERDEVSKGTPGAVYKVTLDNTNPLGFGFPKDYYTLKMDNNIYGFLKNDGWNVGVVKKEKQLAGFVGRKLEPYLHDGLLFGIEERGNGNIVYLADNVLFRDFWENGKLMFANALFLVGN